MKPEYAASAFRADLFSDCRVLVVGGTSGIGRGIAEAFAQHGAQVCATGATDAEVAAAASVAATVEFSGGEVREQPAAKLRGEFPELDVLAATFAQHGGQLRTARASTAAALEFRRLDVRDQPAVAALLGQYFELDVLVNCAGIIRRGDEHDPAVFESVVDINLTGMMRACTAARPALARRGGCAINIASLLTFTGGALIPAYAASKGGVGQLTKSLALAYAADGIRVNALAPGYIVTPLTETLRADPVRHDAILARTALKRWGTAAEVAEAALFLASPSARYITGTILPVDGGYLAS